MAQIQNATGAIAGYFEDQAEAGRAVEALRDAGFTSAHIGVAHRGTTSSTSSTENGPGVWDKIKGFFEGSTAEPYADERTQGDLATREITSNTEDRDRLAGQYEHSDVHASLVGLSVPEDRSRYFGHRFGSSEGGAVVTVNAGDRVAEAESILTQYGADLGENAASHDYSQTTERNDAQNNIQLLGEVLRVHKDRVSRGEVRLRKEIVTDTQTIQVPVTHEELVIERRPVDQYTQAAGSIGESQEIRIPLSEETASVDKSTIVREEVAVGKKPVEEVRDLSSDIRHEELIVDDQTRKVG